MERAEAAVGTVLDAEDAADLVRIARHVRARVTTEGLGGGAVGPLCPDTITVRTDRLNRISVCPRSRSARVGAGVSAKDLAAALAPHGLIATTGDSPHARVAELALTGGIGRFARKHGLASDDVTAFEVVDADGNLLRAGVHENEDLFWALSGGGAGFGLVTAVEVQLHAEPEVFDTTIAWPAAAAREVLAALADVATSAPEELAVRVTVAPGSGTEVTVAVSATFLGPEEDARVLLKPFGDIGGELAAVAVGGAVEPVADPARAVLLSGLDDNVPTLAALPSLHLRHLGGRLAEPSTKGPHGALDGQFAVFLGEPAPRTFRAREWERLREVKAVWDPDGAFAGGDLG